MPDFPNKLSQKLEHRQNENALRKLSTFPGLVDFSSNDYLGLAKSEGIAAHIESLVQKYSINGHSATGSRLLTGNHLIHEAFEAFLANFHGTEAALVFNSGYDANLGFFSAVPQRGDIIFYDEWVHASIRDGISMSKAQNYKFKHNDIADLSEGVLRIKKQGKFQDSTEIYVATESVFSMDGDSPNLSEMSSFCEKEGIHLVVDEAHASGIFGGGKGLVNELGLSQRVFATIVTFGKALGQHGASVLGSKTLIQYLINFARSFIYTTALPPKEIAAVWAAYLVLGNQGQKHIQGLKENIRFFLEKAEIYGLQTHFIESISAIQSMRCSGNDNAKGTSDFLAKQGFDVKPILSPTVPLGMERLRFCLHTFNTTEEINQVLKNIRRFNAS
ncbi:MAG: 8-amino-7-oxononanoate synthase [Bacteroidota bacterium]